MLSIKLYCHVLHGIWLNIYMLVQRLTISIVKLMDNKIIAIYQFNQIWYTVVRIYSIKLMTQHLHLHIYWPSLITLSKMGLSWTYCEMRVFAWCWETYSDLKINNRIKSAKSARFSNYIAEWSSLKSLAIFSVSSI